MPHVSSSPKILKLLEVRASLALCILEGLGAHTLPSLPFLPSVLSPPCPVSWNEPSVPMFWALCHLGTGALPSAAGARAFLQISCEISSDLSVSLLTVVTNPRCWELGHQAVSFFLCPGACPQQDVHFATSMLKICSPVPFARVMRWEIRMWQNAWEVHLACQQV